MALFDDDGLVKFADLDALRRWDNRTWDKAAARKVACDEMTSTAVADDIPWGKKRFMRSLSSAPPECQNPTEGDILELTTADDREFDDEDPPPFEEDLQQQTPVEPQQPKKKSDGKRRRDRERRKRMKEREKEYKRKVAVGAMTRRDVEKEKIKRHVESEMQKRRSEWKKMMQEEMRRKEEKERRKLMANIEEDRQCSSKKADRFRRFNRWRK